MGRPPKTLSELYAPPSTFRWERHRHLIKRSDLDAEDLETALERAAQGFEPWQTAALLECPVHVVSNALLVHKRRSLVA